MLEHGADLACLCIFLTRKKASFAVLGLYPQCIQTARMIVDSSPHAGLRLANQLAAACASDSVGGLVSTL